MRAMLKTRRPAVVLSLALALAGSAACKRHNAPAPLLAPRLDLRSAADARADRVAEVVLPGLERTLASVGAIARKMSLPFGDTELRQLLMARSELPPGVLEKADLGKPAALVVLAGNDKSKQGKANTDVVLAFPLKDGSKAAFDAFAAAAGKVVESQKDAVHVQPGDGGGKDTWLVPREGCVCLAETMNELVAGCALALEARRPVSEDLRVTVVPEGIARASGTTLKAALDKARQQMATLQQQTQGSEPVGNAQLQATAMKLVDAMTSWVLDAVADTSEARLALSIDPTKGLFTSFEVVPRAGSGLAKTIADRHPYAVDPALLAGDPPGALFAVGEMTYVRAAFAAVRGPLLGLIPSEAERTKAGASVDELFAALAGPMSGRLTFGGTGQLPFAYDVVYRLKAGTDGKQLLGDLESMIKAPWMGQLFETAFAGVMKVKLATKHEGDTLLTRVTFDVKKASPKLRASLKSMPGGYAAIFGEPLEGRTAIAGDRMMVTTGAGGKERMAALLAASAAAPAGDLQAALTETKDADAVYYTDLAATLKPMLAMANSAGVAGSPDAANGMAMAGALLANAHLATWVAYRGGPTATVSWRVPMSTFDSVGAIVRSTIGGGH
jgi:hypothetical protein